LIREGAGAIPARTIPTYLRGAARTACGQTFNIGATMICRLILPEWAAQENPTLPRIVEGVFTEDELIDFNLSLYNIHYLPNYPSEYTTGTVDGSMVDTFHWVFADMDLKDGTYSSKQEFINEVNAVLPATKIIDSGNGVHAYWRVADLDGMSFLRLQRRLIRLFHTDEAVAKIFQLMRPEGFVNTKHKDAFKPVTLVSESDLTYYCEDLDKLLPKISPEDEAYCKQHYEKTYKINTPLTVDDKLPLKFAQLLRNNKEVKDIWAGNTDDRSKADYRLGHLMYANDFTKEEAMSVLVNSAKALQRAPQHRIGYAQNIMEKIWTYEVAEDKTTLNLSESVKDILNRHGDTLKGTRFPCYTYLDSTHHGFRLGQVIGLVAGSGVGKTALALNMFMGFVKNNPDFDHFFIPLEQPSNEIADRWRTMCGDNTKLHDKVHVISNYNPDGSFRHLSFDEIKEYILKFQEQTKRKVGCVVLDHIGALKKKGAKGENQDLMDVCHSMKAFAVQTNTLLVMQSQAPREKAGVGDLELNKDAAYGTVFFESYCDYLITMWQPLKRCYNEDGCPTVTAYKFCKIRHKKKELDSIQEDTCYRLYFDSNTETMREMTQAEEKGFDFWLNKATNLRKKDRKTDLVPYKSLVIKGATDGETNHSKDSSRVSSG